MTENESLYEKIKKAKQELFETISRKYGFAIPVHLVPAEKIPGNAEGCFEGDMIKIRQSLPLFIQLIILEHEIGHAWAMKKNSLPLRKKIMYFRKKGESYEQEEIAAWKWVEKHPIRNGGAVDTEVNKFIIKISALCLQSDNPEEGLRYAFWI